jgi:hypothetical protein
MEKQITITVKSTSNNAAISNLIDYLHDYGYSAYSNKDDANIISSFCDNTEINSLRDALLDASEHFDFDYTYTIN